jgi:hypothetical protein
MHFNIKKDRAVRAPASTLVSNRGQGLAQREDSLVTTLKLFDNYSRKTDVLPRLGYGLFWLVLFVASLAAGRTAHAAVDCSSRQTITADVVVCDNPTVFNRLGAQNPNWVTYALRRDVVYMHRDDPGDSNNGKPLTHPDIVGMSGDQLAGRVELRPDKRTRPIVIRSVAGACLTVNFQNLLAPVANPNNAQQGEGVLRDANGDRVANTACDTAPAPTAPDNATCLADGITVNAFLQFPGLINNDQVAGRCAGFHATGTEAANDVSDMGALVGKNDTTTEITEDSTNDPAEAVCGDGLAGPGGEEIYRLFTPHEGAFIINSYGATLGSEANGGNLGLGMFGALNVQPKGARMYRSQVTEEELRLATTGYVGSDCEAAGPNGHLYDDPSTPIDETLDNIPPPVGEIVGQTCRAGGQPIINYEATYPSNEPWSSEGKAGLPILNMLDGDKLVHSDINAIIAGPDADGTWKSKCPAPPGVEHDDPENMCPYPLESVGKTNPQLPDRIMAFREFTSIFHDEQTNAQVFPKWYADPVLGYTLDGVGDAFMINYGSGGIGSEIIANRLHAGVMHDCTDCAYEEFFLSSQTVGDPALLVNFPANTGIEQCDPKNILSPNCWRQFTDAAGNPIGANPPIEGNYALFQEDPSNVHHAYVGDHTKVRNIHAGAFEQHIFHLHNHQWLFNPNDDNANYLDAQEIMPGSGHTYELVNGGVGNRNHTTGDAIFHCHFYPHFAQGMWYHIRIMDVFEKGTVLAVSNADDPQNPSLWNPADPTANFHVNDPLKPSKPKWRLRNGKPEKGARALPDGELPDGVPIPAIVPLPGKAMPPIPAKVEVMAVDRGDFGVLSGREPPESEGCDPTEVTAGPDLVMGTADDICGILNQGADSAQAVVDFGSVAGADGAFGTDDDVSPGYPFWLAGATCGEGGDLVTGACPEGTVGQRQPTPVLDMLTEDGAKQISMDDPSKRWANLGGGWDGGLPRHNLRGYTSGGLSLDTQNRLDFRKVIKMAQPVYYPETGTKLEDVSMRWQAVRLRPTAANMLDGEMVREGTVDENGELQGPRFLMNGSGPVPGGPYNDPCIDDEGDWAVSNETHDWFDGQDLNKYTLGTKGGSAYGADRPRTYKIANVQIDAVFNKVGHHYSQERIIALWEDVLPTINKQRPPEPLVMRFNTFDCGKLLHSNLVPAEFEVDDFQVRTPTDIIGQHIHLPKWDLTTGDGAANGWNYEDGALAPLMVQERIKAINNFNALAGTNMSLVDILTNVLIDEETGVPLADELHPDLVAALGNHQVNLSGLQAVETIDTGDPGAGAPGYDYKLGLKKLKALPHPFFGTGKKVNGHYEYKGARTVIQRILVDPVVNVAGADRGLGLTFSHDHYGPSTFQQIGLYSTILAEPAASEWYHNESGEKLNNYDVREDGGPTTWQAAIITPNTAKLGSTVKAEEVVDHREFYFEMSDFQHAYKADTYVAAGPDGRPLYAEVHGQLPQIHYIDQPDPFNATQAFADTINGTWRDVVNPTLKLEAHDFPDVVTAEGGCPGLDDNGNPTNGTANVPRPCAEAINIGHSSTWVTNYRNEPIGLRVFDPDAKGPDGQNGAQAAGKAGDLAFALQSRTDRAIRDMGTAFGNTPYPTGPSYCEGAKGDYINCDRGNGDPFTPIMRAYEGDEVKIKIQVGATEEQHQTTVHGIKWLSNGSGFGRSPNSGWRNFQSHGISEQFSLQVPVNPDPLERGKPSDYFYATDATRPGFWLGTWGILRSYNSTRQDLKELYDNPFQENNRIVNKKDFSGVCPRTAPVRTFEVYAVLANDVLPNAIDVDGIAGPDIEIMPNTQMFDAGPDKELGTSDDILLGGDSDGDGIGDNAGGPLNPNGGTLVYNRRATVVEDFSDISPVWTGGAGPLNDPTAMMYFLAEDLEPADMNDERCFEAAAENKNGKGKGGSNQGQVDYNMALEGCPVKLKVDAGADGVRGTADDIHPPVEPLVLRANAGECIEVTLHNKLVDQAQYQVGVDPDDKPVYEHVYSCEVDPIALEDVYDESGNLVSEGYYQCDPLQPYTPLFDGDQASDDLDQGKMHALADGYLIQYMDEYGALVKNGDIEFDDRMPDLAGYQTMMWAVTRRVEDNPGGTAPTPNDPTDDEMYFFDNNLVRPSAYVGLHPQLVEYDITRHDGTVVGNNSADTLAKPGGNVYYKWYAGDLYHKKTNRGIEIVPTAIEFGGSNLLSADRIKQPQKGMFGALVIEPPGAAFPTALADLDDVPDGQGTGSDTRKTRAQITITSEPDDAGSGGIFREALAISHKIANLRWADGSAIRNVNQEEFGREGAEDSGQAGFNYGMEPSWFRFKLPPNVPSGNALQTPGYGSIPNVQAFYANELVRTEKNAIPEITGVSAAGDPQTPVFRTTAGLATRMHVLNGASADRDSTFVLHGHVWQRDPFVCTGTAQDASVPLKGRCDPKLVAPSQRLGLNPQGKYMGGEEGMGHVYGHWPILFDAGGTGAVPGDYLYRDYTPSGNRNGMFGILRAE